MNKLVQLVLFLLLPFQQLSLMHVVLQSPHQKIYLEIVLQILKALFHLSLLLLLPQFYYSFLLILLAYLQKLLNSLFPFSFLNFLFLCQKVLLHEIYLDFLPRGSYIDAGIWELTLNPRRITAGSYDLWLPGESVIGNGTGFLYPTETTTLTIPSTAAKVISVGAYNAAFNSYAAFSGRGFTRMEHRIKPDLAAPGVNIISAAPGGGYTSKSGTSMAAPFVTGSCALLMEWGIVRGNDPYLYSEKVKAYLIRGTKKLPAFTEYPNPYIGWGTLCTADSIPTKNAQ